MKAIIRAIPMVVAALFLAMLPACETMDAVSDVGAAVGQGAGVLTPEQAKSVKKAGSAVGKTFDRFTPEQEYYIGRTVGAVVVNQYKPLANDNANRYLNLLGQTLAQFSDKPETFGGYHFLVLETGEVNAFAAPGGLIFVSRGMLKCCKSEDAAAAVLAHEIGHVQCEHGIKAINKSRYTSAVTTILVEAGKSLSSQELAQLTEAFEGSINDITGTMMNSGYARSAERQADQAAVTILQRAGYDPNALIALLTEMKAHVKPGGPGFGKTHPAPEDRIADVKKAIGAMAAGPAPAARQARFAQALGNM